jgi:hypothetical protein
VGYSNGGYGRGGYGGGGQRRGPRSYTEPQHKRINEHVLLHVLPDKPGGVAEQQVMQDLIAILSVEEWRDGSRITTKAASAVIDWLADLPWAEGCEPAAPGIYHDRRTEEAGGQLLIVLERQAPKKGAYAMLLTPQIRPGRPLRLDAKWDPAHAETSGLTEAMRVTGAEYEMLLDALPAKLFDRLTDAVGQPGDGGQEAAADVLAKLVAARRAAAA